MLLKNKYIILVLVFILISINTELLAQCPMCRVSAETNLANGGTEGAGLNKGILYMLSLPYILISVIGYVWYKNNKKKKSLEQ